MLKNGGTGRTKVRRSLHTAILKTKSGSKGASLSERDRVPGTYPGLKSRSIEAKGLAMSVLSCAQGPQMTERKTGPAKLGQERVEENSDGAAALRAR